MAQKLSKEAYERKLKYSKEYNKQHRKEISKRTLTVGCTFRRDLDSYYIDIWKSIPDKKQWLKEQLEAYKNEQH